MGKIFMYSKVSHHICQCFNFTSILHYMVSYIVTPPSYMCGHVCFYINSSYYMSLLALFIETLVHRKRFCIIFTCMYVSRPFIHICIPIHTYIQEHIVLAFIRIFINAYIYVRNSCIIIINTT